MFGVQSSVLSSGRSARHRVSQHTSVQQLTIKKGVEHTSMCDTRDDSRRGPISNLFLPVPDTDFRDFLDEVARLLRFAPEIITAIEGDLDAHAREKKKLRIEDRKFFESLTEDLPELEIEQTEVSGEDLTLGVGSSLARRDGQAGVSDLPGGRQGELER